MSHRSVAGDAIGELDPPLDRQVEALEARPAKPVALLVAERARTCTAWNAAMLNH